MDATPPESVASAQRYRFRAAGTPGLRASERLTCQAFLDDDSVPAEATSCLAQVLSPWAGSFESTRLESPGFFDIQATVSVPSFSMVTA